MLNKIKELCRLSFRYFISSLKSISTWILIIFNLFLLVGFLKNSSFISNLILSYLIQISMSILFFGLLIFSLRSLKSKGKTYSGKGTKTGEAIYVLFMWIFYGIAVYMLLSGTLKLVHRLELGFFIGILILFFSILLNFIVNFTKERQRLENTDIVKIFFEPASNLFPIYISVILLIIFNGELGVLIVILKTLADIIVNSPLNAENPFIYQILGGDERLKRMGY